jgi:hypothetical protein
MKQLNLQKLYVILYFVCLYIKYLGTDSTKNMKNLYDENYKILIIQVKQIDVVAYFHIPGY